MEGPPQDDELKVTSALHPKPSSPRYYSDQVVLLSRNVYGFVIQHKIVRVSNDVVGEL